MENKIPKDRESILALLGRKDSFKVEKWKIKKWIDPSSKEQVISKTGFDEFGNDIIYNRSDGYFSVKIFTLAGKNWKEAIVVTSKGFFRRHEYDENGIEIGFSDSHGTSRGTLKGITTVTGRKAGPLF